MARVAAAPGGPFLVDAGGDVPMRKKASRPGDPRESSSGRRDGSRGRRETEDEGDSPENARPVSNVSTLDRDGVLAALGYKSEKLKEWKTTPVVDSSELCQRCHKKVYAVEKIDIGVLYHRGCFKCSVCGLQLSLRSFHGGGRQEDDPAGAGAVYCRKHAPSHIQAGLGADAVEIRRALDAQKHTSAKARVHGPDMPASHYQQDEEVQLRETDDIRRTQKVKRSSTLRSWKDFESFGVFDAQTELEKIHRKEEDDLYREMAEERRRKVDRMERHLAKQRDRTVQELVAWFDKKETTKENRELGLKQVEQYFKTQRGERMRLLKQRLAMEEQAAVARMIEKHSHEMLTLIAEMEEDAFNTLTLKFEDQRISADTLQRLQPAMRLEEGRGVDQRRGVGSESSEEGSQSDESPSEQSYVLDGNYPAMQSRQPPRPAPRHSMEQPPANEKVPGGHVGGERPSPSVRRRSSKERPVEGAGQQRDVELSPSARRKAKHDRPANQTAPIGHVRDVRGTPESQRKQRSKTSKRVWKPPEEDLATGIPQEPNRPFSMRAHSASFDAKLPVDRPAGEAEEEERWVDPQRYTDDLYLRPTRPRFSDVVPVKPENTETPHDISMRKNNLTGKRSSSGKDPVFFYESMASEFHRNGDYRFVPDHRVPGGYLDNRWNEARAQQRDARGKKDLQDARNRQAQSSAPGGGGGAGGGAGGAGGAGGGQGTGGGQGVGGKYSAPRNFRGIGGEAGSGTRAPSGGSGRGRGRWGGGVGGAALDAHGDPASDKKAGSRPEAKPRSSLKVKDGSLTRHSTLKNELAEGQPDPDISPIGGTDRSRGRNSRPTASARSGPGGSGRRGTGRGSDGDGDESASDDDEGGEDDGVFLNEAATPAVVPPKDKKSDLYSTPEIFKDFDTRAEKEAQRDHKTFTDLVRRLSKRCETELQKVRAVFRWVTLKDLNKITFDETLDPDSPMGLLRGIKLGKETYHNLFKRLCSYVGIHCEVIEGYSKGVGYRPGDKFKGTTFRNQWTAVWIQGAWRFINCNWGARHVKGPRDDHMTYKCDEFYFLTDPEEHIYQHYPDEDNWQLLKRPISLHDFVKLPVLKSPFFNHGLSFPIHYDSILEAHDGTADIRVCVPRFLNFAAKLKSRDRQIRSEMLEDRVLIRRHEQEVIFTVNLPVPGTYFIELYVSRNWLSESMDNACAFRIQCYDVSSDAHKSFPPVGCFGRTPHFSRSGLSEESHTDTYISCTGELTLTFQCPKEVKTSHSLRLWNNRDKKLLDYDRYAFHSFRSDSRITYMVQCPRRGSYVLSLFADNPTRPEAEMECVYRYFIDCQTPKENASPFPKASKRWRHCRLVEPMKGDLNMKTKVRFRVESAVALEIVVAVDKTWTQLKEDPVSDVWQGAVYTGDKAGKVAVYGRFDSSKEKYIPLLEYQVKGEVSLEDQVRTLYKYMT